MVSALVLLPLIGSLLLLLLVLFFVFKKTGPKHPVLEKPKSEDTTPSSTPEPSPTPAPVRVNKRIRRGTAGARAVDTTHLHAINKGHTAGVTCIAFSPDGRFFASCALDRTLRITHCQMLTEKQHHSVRVNLDMDDASAVCFSPDSKYIVVALASSVRLDIYDIRPMARREPPKRVLSFQPEMHPAPIHTLIVRQKFILTASQETFVKLWNLRGDRIQNINTSQLITNAASVGPEDRPLILIGSWTSEALVRQVQYSKDQSSVTGVSDPIILLQGHKSSINAVSIAQDGMTAVSASKDGSWKRWTLPTEYRRFEPDCLTTVPCGNGQPLHHISLAPNGHLVAVAQDSKLMIFTVDGAEVMTILQPGEISALAWHPSSEYIATSSVGIRHVHFWRVSQ